MPPWGHSHQITEIRGSFPSRSSPPLQRWGSPYLSSLGTSPGRLRRSLPPFTPQLILPGHTTLWASTAGNLTQLWVTAWRSWPLSQVWHLSTGTQCLVGQGCWHTFLTKAFISLPIHSLKTQLLFVSSPVWALGFQWKWNLGVFFPFFRFCFIPLVPAFSEWFLPSTLLVKGKS